MWVVNGCGVVVGGVRGGPGVGLGDALRSVVVEKRDKKTYFFFRWLWWPLSPVVASLSVPGAARVIHPWIMFVDFLVSFEIGGWNSP
jgi:hypothetical protein